MNVFNDRKTEKCHESTNIAQVKTTPIMMAAVADVGTLAGFTEFKTA